MGTTYGDLFAANLRAARARQGLHISTVARRMKRLGYTSYSGGKLSEVERGVRNIPVAELLALSVCVGCTIRDLVGEAAPDARIAFADEQFSVTGVTVRNSGYGWNDASVTWTEGDEYPAITRPANAFSAGAQDRSLLLGNTEPYRFARQTA